MPISLYQTWKEFSYQGELKTVSTLQNAIWRLQSYNHISTSLINMLSLFHLISVSTTFSHNIQNFERKWNVKNYITSLVEYYFFTQWQFQHNEDNFCPGWNSVVPGVNELNILIIHCVSCYLCLWKVQWLTQQAYV